VLVINSGIGGSFGGRFVLSWQIHGALLAVHTEQPVKVLYTREEAFLARYHRHPTRIWVRHHATKDGTIVKIEAKVVVEDGPYINTAGPGIGNACTLLQGPYNIPNARIEGWAVGTNNGMCGSLRGFGVVEPMYASESNLDALALALGMDGAELRRRNAMKEGDTWTFDQLMDSPAPVRELIDASGQAPLPEPLADDASGISLPGGIVTPTRPRDVVRATATSSVAKNVCLSEGAPVNSNALVTLRDGEVVIECAAAEVGQGFKTIAEQIAQTTLGISKVTITGSDSGMADGSTTDGQLQTMTSGGAVHKAAATVKERFLRFVSRHYGHDVKELDIRDDYVVLSDGPRLMPVADAGMHLVFRATARFEQRQTWELEGREPGQPMHVTFNFSATRCTVDVDRELGLVRVVAMDVVQDVGRVVNPAQATGQIAGGILMGVGIALMEDFPYADGVPTRLTWDDYLVPTMIDAPRIDVRFLENPEPRIPYGMRGIAELPHVQGPPAVLAALRAGTGLPLPALPAPPERVADRHPAETPSGVPTAPAKRRIREDAGSARAVLGDPMREPVSLRRGPWNP
ncbi:MAG: xanthine dehydrogenase family protein molybdopterin-binding subunit, partial [bacterium]